MEDQLTKSVLAYQRLKPVNLKKASKIYEDIRTKSLIEVYISPILNKIISEEEMSGFILYLDERLEAIILGFKLGKGNYLAYLLQTATFRALNYLSRKVRLARMDFALSKYVYAEEQRQQYNADNFEDKEQGYIDQSSFNILKGMCNTRPSFQRKFFIYILSISAYLKTEVIEAICKDFNFDLKQTLFIINDLFEKAMSKDYTTTKQKYLERRNTNWSQFLYIGTKIDEYRETGGIDQLQYLDKQADKYMQTSKRANQRLDLLKRHMNYSDIASKLKIPIGTVSSTIYFIRSVLKAIGMKEVNPEIQELVERAKLEKNRVLPHFKPYCEFMLEGPLEDDLLEE